MTVDEKIVKKEIEEFYEDQSTEKTRDINTWLNSGKVRIPQPLSYYYFENRKIDKALEMSRLPRGAKILEIGCSLGQMTFVLNQKGFPIIGVDLSPNSIEKANLRVQHFNLSSISFEVQDAEHIQNHHNEEFDAVLSFSTFRYFPNPDKALRECYRLLKPSGCAVIDFPNRKCPWYTLIKPALNLRKNIHDHLYEADEVRDMMEQAGFVDIQVRQFLFSYKQLPSIFLPLMIMGDVILERMPIVNRKAGIIMAKGIKP